jgi:hypothetical protein
MRPLKAHVHNGRLVLDEATDLPEGEVMYLQPADAITGDADGASGPQVKTGLTLSARRQAV